MMRSRVNAKSMAYAATSLGAHLMNAVFTFYYIKIYLNRFHVTSYWFNLSQVVFMLWNAVNDPLFGCLQDSVFVRRRWAFLRTRRQSILYGAPLFTLSFLVTWLPWADYDAPSTPAWVGGVQLVTVLCFYDTLFTFVLLAQCALFTELSGDQEDRVRLIQYSQVAALLGSTSVYFCEFVSHSLELWSAFQGACALIALLAFVCFVYTGLHAHTPYDVLASAQPEPEGVVKQGAQKGQRSDMGAGGQGAVGKSEALRDVRDAEEIRALDGGASHLDDAVSTLRKTAQIFAQPSFVSFVLTNFLQIFHSIYLGNFASIVCDRLIGNDEMSREQRGIFYGALFTLPQILLIVGSPLVTRFGYYRVIRCSFVLKIALGVTLFMIGRGHTWFLVAFFLAESSGASATFSLFNLPLSDVIDCDARVHARRHPLSSMVFGLNALVTKPAISLSPMLAVAIFNRHGYSNHATSALTQINSTIAQSHTSAVAGSDAGLADAMFDLTCAIPVAVGLLQLGAWSFYTIRESHRHRVLPVHQ